MKNLSISIVLFFISILTFGQKKFQGKAYYQTKTTIDLDGFGGDKMSPERKKRIMEGMKSFLEKTYILTFNKTESSYKEDEKLAAPGSRGFGMMMSSFTGGSQYKNVKDKQLLQEQEFFGKQFLIVDKLQDLKWEMGSETKQIGQYMCFKATATKKLDEFDWKSMRRKKDDKKNEGTKKDSTQTQVASLDDIEVPKEINITAWYTPQIPINQGPSDYYGLPGLILEVNADRTTILCTKIVLNPEEKEVIQKPSKGKQVTKKEYNDIMKKKIEEMREMYGGRKGSGRGRH